MLSTQLTRHNVSNLFPKYVMPLAITFNCMCTLRQYGRFMLLIGFTASIAHAQNPVRIDPFNPPSILLNDENGVNLTESGFDFQIPVTSIGNIEDKLEYILTSKGGYIFTDNVQMFDNHTIVAVSGISCTGSINPNPICVNIDTGDRSYMFVFNDTNKYNRHYSCCSSSIDGEYLDFSGPESARSFSFTDRNGVIFSFPIENSATRSEASNILRNQLYSNGRAYLASTVTYPSGYKVSYNFERSGGYFRKRSISDNRGQAIIFRYSSPVSSASSYPTSALNPSSIQRVNSSYQYCDPSWNCQNSSNVATITSSSNEANITITDNGNLRIVVDQNKLPINLYMPHKDISIERRFSVPFAQAPAYTSPINPVSRIQTGDQTWLYNFTTVQGGQTILRTNNLIRTSPLNETSTTTTYNYATYREIIHTDFGRPNDRISQRYEFTGYQLNISYPEGNRIGTPRDSRGNIRFINDVSKAPAISSLSTTLVFDNVCSNRIICNKPISIQDAKGATTSFTYASEHGGILTETFPVDNNGISSVKRHGYVQRYALIKNKSGGFTPAMSPIWVLATTKMCRTTATIGDGCAGGAPDEVVTTYEYGPNSGPNNLWVRGRAVTADGQTLRTCYGYDQWGNKISETLPRANIAVCP